MKILDLVLFIVIFSEVATVDQGDWVDTFKLPIGYLTHPFFAGYLNISSSHAYYYNYFPSESNPGKDPLIVRISAGPGCSALYSTFYSKGPFIFVRNTKNFRVNPNNWNKQANLLFIQGPGQVGFSKGDMKQHDDESTSLYFYAAILKFYQKYPQLKDQTMYLSGQQYAGVFIPRIAQTIIQINKDPDTPAWQKIKLGGFLLTNPCTLGDECSSHNAFTKHTIKYLYTHYFISEEQYQDYISKCTLDTPQCESAIKSIESHFMNTGADLNNIYAECLQQEGSIKCLDQVGIVSFLNDPQVKTQMHADPSITWKECNSDIQQTWIRDPNGSMKIYERLLREQRDLRIWIVSGVMSGAIPVSSTKMWFDELKHNLGLSTTRMWQPWYYNQTVNAGDIEQIRGMSLITVRSAGNYLFNDQPQLGYHVLDSFIKGVLL